MSDIALVRVTFGEVEEAGRIVQRVIEERLAACANVAPCASTFRWNGRIETADEATAIFKTTIALAQRLAARIAELHSYDRPVIETWPVAVDDAVRDWVDDSTNA